MSKSILIHFEGSLFVWTLYEMNNWTCFFFRSEPFTENFSCHVPFFLNAIYKVSQILWQKLRRKVSFKDHQGKSLSFNNKKTKWFVKKSKKTCWTSLCPFQVYRTLPFSQALSDFFISLEHKKLHEDQSHEIVSPTSDRWNSSLQKTEMTRQRLRLFVPTWRTESNLSRHFSFP